MSDSVGLSGKQIGQVSQLAELEVRRYFDHYLTNVFPVQVEAAVRAHDQSHEAHCGRIKSLDKARWVLAGALTVVGFAGGISVDRLLSLIGG